MNIFYSWQTDTPDKTGKAFIRLALDDAVSEMAEDMGLSEADRPSVDQDTQGVMGSPGIAETIFEKIKSSEVMVVDVTLVGKTSSGKKLINSNVACELGFAHGWHGDQVLLAVMNTHYGPPEDLPFDLQHRRWPLRYKLSPDSSREERKVERVKLSKQLKPILKLYLQTSSQKEIYEPVPSTINVATYWQDDEPIVNRSGDDDYDDLKLKINKGQALAYLRIWPDKPLNQLSGKELNDYQISVVPPLLERIHSTTFCRNKYGTITYAGGSSGKLISATQVFKNREIWGVEAFILKPKDEYDFNFVPTKAFEEGIAKSLNTYLEIAYNRFNYTDIVHIETGLINVEGFKLAMPPKYVDRFWGPLFGNVSVQATVKKNDPETVNAALKKIYEAVFDEAGAERPKKLYGF